MTYDITRASVESFALLWLGLHALLLSVAPDADLVRPCGSAARDSASRWSCELLRPAPCTETGRSRVGLTGIALALHRLDGPRGQRTRPARGCWPSPLGAFAATRRVKAMAFACVCLVWLRPGCCPALGLLAWWNHPHGRRVAVLSIGALAVLLLMRQQLYGEWLPMTAFAKSPNLGHGMHYVGEWVRSTGLLTLLCLAWWRPWQALGVAALAMMAALTGGDWMPGDEGRWRRRSPSRWPSERFTPAAPWYHWRSSLGLGRVDMTWREAMRPFAGTTAPSQTSDNGCTRRQTSSVCWLSTWVDWVAGYASHDLAGLTDKHIGQLPGSHGQKSFDATYFEQQAPIRWSSPPPTTPPRRLPLLQRRGGGVRTSLCPPRLPVDAAPSGHRTTSCSSFAPAPNSLPTYGEVERRTSLVERTRQPRRRSAVALPGSLA